MKDLKNQIREILDSIEFEPTELSCSRCNGSGWIMMPDPKDPTEPIQTECDDCYATGKITDLRVKEPDQVVAALLALFEKEIARVKADIIEEHGIAVSQKKANIALELQLEKARAALKDIMDGTSSFEYEHKKAKDTLTEIGG